MLSARANDVITLTQFAGSGIVATLPPRLRCRVRTGCVLRGGPAVAYDLPITIGPLRASAQPPSGPQASAAFLGELSLDGALRDTPGMLPMVLVAHEAGLERVHVPAANAHEASLVAGVEV